jgi:hypothetical protein
MLKPIAPDVWHLPAPSMRFPGGLRMPIAATVIRLPDRSLAVYSPVALGEAAVGALTAEGEVAHIVAPSLLHHLHARAAAERFPRATVHAAPGLRAKQPDVPAGRELGGSDPAWGGALEALVIGGAPRLNEGVLFHRPSGTLVVADLAFNVTEPETFMTRVILGMMGVGGRRLAQSRMWKVAVRDRAAARASLDTLLDWPIRRVVPTHGAPVEIDASGFRAVVERAYGTSRSTGLLTRGGAS